MKYLITRNRVKKDKSASSHEHTHYFKCLEFYQLKVGDLFKHDKKLYKKIDDETGRLKNGHKKHFWPTENIYLIKPLQLEELNIEYPITAYEY